MTELETAPSETVADTANTPGDILPEPPRSTSSHAPATPYRPSYVFLAVVSATSLAADLLSKLWAERRLDGPDAYFHPVELIKGHLDFVLAKNRGGAWGLLQDTPEYIRRPFFLLVSVLAITFIVSLYRRLAPTQRIDFIHAHMKWGGRDHSWPTFNVADIAICVGVGLMALDMFGGGKQKLKTSDAS